MTNPKAAGLSTRFVAAVIDYMILSSISVLVISGTYFTRSQYYPNVVCFLLGIVYFVWFLSSSRQATPGKRAVGIYVARAEDNRPLTPLVALARTLVIDAF